MVNNNTDNKFNQDGSFSHTLPTTSKGSIKLELLGYKFTNIEHFTLQNTKVQDLLYHHSLHL
jgi:hypothetical protein